MAVIEKAMPTIFLHEGRTLVNDKNDPGGLTKFGVSLRFLDRTGRLSKNDWVDCDINHDGDIDAQDIRDLTTEAATRLYKIYFWDKLLMGAIQDQDLATKFLDMSLPMGTYAASKCMQRAIRSAIGLKLTEDGIFGIKSLAGLNMCKPPILLAAFKSECAGYFRMINYRRSEDFLTGWLRRAYDKNVPTES